MTRFAALMCLWLLACDKKAAAPFVPEGSIRLPPNVEGAQPAGEIAPGAVVELGHDGVIRLGGKRVTYDGLHAGLALLRARVGTIRVGGNDVSTLDVLLRVDERAAWLHVQWLLTALSDQRIHRVKFAVAGGTLDANLPADQGIRPLVQGPPNEILVAVLVRGRDPVRYSFGDREATDPTRVGVWLKEAVELCKEVENAAVLGEISAHAKTGFGAVLAVMGRMRAAGLTEIRFFSGTAPPRSVGSMRTLPAPKVDWRVLPFGVFEEEELVDPDEDR